VYRKGAGSDMNKFSIDEAASEEIRRIFGRSGCRDPVASISEVLPWMNADRFSIDAVDANGKVGNCKNPTQAMMPRIASPPKPMAIAPGESMEGEIDLEVMPISALPRNVDVLLFWSYWIRDWRDDAPYIFSGKILLEAKS
jgi:hypothetical protein